MNYNGCWYKKAHTQMGYSSPSAPHDPQKPNDPAGYRESQAIKRQFIMSDFLLSHFLKRLFLLLILLFGIHYPACK
jgi:hypothetical protein